MPVHEWQRIAGAATSPEEAWRVMDDWKAKRKEIGLLYCGRAAGTVVGLSGRVAGVRNGVVQVKGEGAGMSVNLKGAQFRYGPMKVWPRWPAPATVEVVALQAYLEGGEWLVLAEGYVPVELAPLALPA